MLTPDQTKAVIEKFTHWRPKGSPFDQLVVKPRFDSEHFLVRVVINDQISALHPQVFLLSFEPVCSELSHDLVGVRRLAGRWTKSLSRCDGMEENDMFSLDVAKKADNGHWFVDLTLYIPKSELGRILSGERPPSFNGWIDEK